MEFTIENKKLYLFADKDGKKDRRRRIQIAFDMLKEKNYNGGDGCRKSLTDEQLKILNHPCFDKNVIKQ